MAVMSLFEKVPATKGAMEQLAVSRFASALAAYTASGVNTDTAMKEAMEVVEHAGLKRKAAGAYALMIDSDEPRSLAQAAILQIDSAIDNIEPALAAFLTVAVGATLISVMMPLIGIMGSIG